MQWLVEDFNATVDLKAPDECTALWTACFNGHRDVVSYLLRVGADDTVQGKPPGYVKSLLFSLCRLLTSPLRTLFLSLQGTGAVTRNGRPSQSPPWHC